MNNKSFTLIELLVVIVIIGILAGVIMISTSSSIDKASFAKAQTFSNAVQEELLLNLVSEWTFDDLSNYGYDSWGTNNGTLHLDSLTSGAGDSSNSGPLSKSNCVYGTCLKFDGIDDYAEATGIPLVGNTSITMSFWAKAIANTLGNDVLVVYGNNGTSGECAGLYYNASINYVRFTGWSNALYDYSTSFVKDFNVWHYWVITYNGSQVLIYRDGTADSNGTQSKTLNFTSGKLLIGGNSVSRFNSSIDDVRIYGAILSSFQIKQNYIVGLNSLLKNGNISKEKHNQRIETLGVNF